MVRAAEFGRIGTMAVMGLVLATGCRGTPAEDVSPADEAPPIVAKAAKAESAPAAVLPCPADTAWATTPYPGAKHLPGLAAYTSLGPGQNVASETFRTPVPVAKVVAYVQRCLPNNAPSREGGWATFSLPLTKSTLAQSPRAKRTLAVRSHGKKTEIRVTCIGCG